MVPAACAAHGTFCSKVPGLPAPKRRDKRRHSAACGQDDRSARAVLSSIQRRRMDHNAGVFSQEPCQTAHESDIESGIAFGGETEARESRIVCQDASGETKPHMTIPKDVRKSFVEHVSKMAFRGQFSKKKEMRSNACQAFCHLAYLEPDAILPLVYQRYPTPPCLYGRDGWVSLLDSWGPSIRPMLRPRLSPQPMPLHCAFGRY